MGTSFKKYLEQYPDDYYVEELDVRDDSWKEFDFSSFDVVYHVAGLAHSTPDESQRELYYRVNTDLTYDVALKAKESRVSQFIFMSSMIVYSGCKEKIITSSTAPRPLNFYGDSKWQADKGVRKLADDNFHVAVLRPPMIYGKGSKGNYPLLAKMAKKLPVFPDIQNERSMLYIGNLCEFLCLLMKSGEGGIYFPQNAEYVRTSEMVRQIAKAAGHRIWITKLLNPAVWIASLIPGKVSGMVNKAFGNMVYEKDMGTHFKGTYQLINLKKSIKVAEE